jgi:hypothetical protein
VVPPPQHVACASTATNNIANTASGTNIRRLELAIMFSLSSLRREMTLLFVYSPTRGKATSRRGESQIDEDCMLGKLCRLAKQCGQIETTTLTPNCRNRLAMDRTQRRGVDEVYIKLGVRRDSLPGNNAPRRMLRAGNVARHY